MELLDTNLYSVLGEDGITRMVAAFYRQVPADDILGPMYPSDDLAGAEQRLRDFLIQRLGGPDHYSRMRGHPRLRMRHGPFQINQAARDRWIALMSHAIRESNLPPHTHAPLLGFFHHVATFLINAG